MATTPAPSPTGTGVQIRTPATTSGSATVGTRGGGPVMAPGVAVRIGTLASAVTEGAPDHVENTCWRYANPSAGSAK